MVDDKLEHYFEPCYMQDDTYDALCSCGWSSERSGMSDIQAQAEWQEHIDEVEIIKN